MIVNKMSCGKLTLVLGPMYSGKTTYLLNLVRTIENFVVFKHKSDNRYQLTNIISHKNQSHHCIPISKIEEINNLINENTSNILIDEGQFFENLSTFVKTLVNEQKKNVYISGLDGDFEQKPFGNGDLLNLIPFADEVIILKSKCYICNNPAPFSKRLCKNSSQILIGSTKLYQPVCRVHLN